MSKKVVLGLAAGLFALGMWACGDGTIDAPSDKELIFVGKMSEELDARAVDSMVALCDVKPECKKAMDLAFKNDKFIREITDSIIVDEDGDTTYIYSSGYLPSMSFAKDNSSSSAFVEEETISSANVSSSSRRGSGGSSEDDPVYIVSSNSTSGSGDEEGPQKQEQSSSSRTVYSSVTISSSSAKQSSSSYATLPSSSSKKVTPTSSSSGLIHSSTSIPENCNVAVAGTCKPNKAKVERFEEVTWTFTPAAGSRTGGEIVWNNYDDVFATQNSGLTFKKTFSSLDDKKTTEFTMDAETCIEEGMINIVPCDPVTVVPRTLRNCKCELVGDATVDLVALNGGVAKEFTWKVSGCSAFGPSSSFGYSWDMDGSAKTATLKMSLVKPKKYQPKVTVSLLDGSEVESTDAPECPVLTIKNDLLPTEIETVGNAVTVTSGDRLQIVGSAKTSGKNLRCWRYNGTWQNGACTVDFESGETVSTSMPNCSSNDGWQHVTYPLSNLGDDDIVTITMSDVTSGTSQLQCKVLQ